MTETENDVNGEWINTCTLETTTNPDVDGIDGWAKLMETTSLTRYYRSPNKIVFLGEAFSGEQTLGNNLLISFTNGSVASGTITSQDLDSDSFECEDLDGTRGHEFEVWSLPHTFDEMSRAIMKARKDPPDCDGLAMWAVIDLGINDVTLQTIEPDINGVVEIILNDLQKFFEQCDDIMTLMGRYPLRQQERSRGPSPASDTGN